MGPVGLSDRELLDWAARTARYERQLESSERRARGAHFTPPFAVEHLLERALEPALDAHAERLAGLRPAAARDACLAFRVADLACGAGNFLVAALPRLVRRFQAFFPDEAELARLCAEHCLHGLDLDPLAIDLAQSGIALACGSPDTRVPNLRVGDGLTDGFGAASGGFDVLLGNPPWHEATVEENAFWARHAPGLRALAQGEQEAAKRRLRAERPDLVERYQRERARAEALRRALVAGAHPGMSIGDPDLYKAFCWRFWQLAREPGGRIGLVLPRSALTAHGSSAFRSAVLASGGDVDVTTLTNGGGWVFAGAEPRYTVALVALERGSAGRAGEVALRGPYASAETYRAGLARPPARLASADVQSWGRGAPLPQLPDARSAELFARMRRAPRLDLDVPGAWRARPMTELHATRDKGLLELAGEGPPGFWSVYKGESFDLWQPDTGRRYAWADPAKLLPELQARRLRAGRSAHSAFAECSPAWRADPDTLPCLAPRIAFRDVSRATDTRTLRAALVPPRVLLANQAPFLVWPRGSACDQAYLLGVLCSLPLDWYARRFVETHVNYHLLNALPVPRPAPDDPRARRVVELAGRLACPDARFAGWARALGVEHGPLTEAERRAHSDALDAAVAELYGLAAPDLRHIRETFRPQA